MSDFSHRLLAEGISVSNNTRETGLSNNDLIIGPTGGGKTRSYVLPNLLETEESFLVTDTKGALRKQVGALLEKRGFQVIELDFSDLRRSAYGYNPLRFIRWGPRREDCYEQDILTVASALVPIQITKDPFWDYAARELLSVLIGYTLECLPPEEQNMSSVVKLLDEAKTGVLDDLMKEFEILAPDSFVAGQWKRLQNGREAERTYASILGMLVPKMAPFAFDGGLRLAQNPRQIDFAQMSRQRTAVFVKMNDCDFSLKPLTSLFYTQALQALIQEADRRPDNRLEIPVRLYLDDFANLDVPDFDKIISIIRSREISVSVVLQSVTQLAGLYGGAQAMTIIDNCDHLLYLGGQSLETASFIGSKANKPSSAILNMPLGEAWLFERGSQPRRVRKYDLKSHPRYRELPEYAAEAKLPPSGGAEAPLEEGMELSM